MVFNFFSTKKKPSHITERIDVNRYKLDFYIKALRIPGSDSTGVDKV